LSLALLALGRLADAASDVTYRYRDIVARTQDGATATVELTVHETSDEFSIDETGDACEIAVKLVTSRYTVEELIGHRKQYESDLVNVLKVLKADTVTVDNLSVVEEFHK